MSFAWLELNGQRFTVTEILERATVGGGWFELHGWRGRVEGPFAYLIGPVSHRSGHRHRGTRAWARRHSHKP